MEDVTDRVFRRICRGLGADLLYTEFASSDALVRDAEKTLRKIRVEEDERPIGIQIFGGVEEAMEGAAAIAEAAGPDFIDINCGCWVRKVAMREAGAGLLRDLAKFRAIVAAVVRGTRLPVTVKTRLGWDDQSIVILDVARMLEDLGVRALTVHCRTRSQGHRGEADWSWLSRLKETVSIPIIGNGDVNTPEDVARMFDTGCDGVMIGRAALRRPWIFREARHYLRTGELLDPPTLSERVDLCVRHLRLSVAAKGERKGVIEFRKHLSGYLGGLPRGAKVRAELVRFDEAAAVIERLQQYRDEGACFGAV